MLHPFVLVLALVCLNLTKEVQVIVEEILINTAAAYAQIMFDVYANDFCLFYILIDAVVSFACTFFSCFIVNIYDTL